MPGMEVDKIFRIGTLLIFLAVEVEDQAQVLVSLLILAVVLVKRMPMHKVLQRPIL
jgi:hypothetical protein